MPDDPWKGLQPPESLGAISARRVDATLPWGFFWARGADRSYMLVLMHTLEGRPGSRLPAIRGIEVLDTHDEAAETRMLAFKLLMPDHRDLFERLCRDIVDSTRGAATEAEAVDITLARTWRWHHLLRGGQDGRLSLEAQKGLYGEMRFLHEVLLPNVSMSDAVGSWQGPMGGPKDFVIGRVCVEVKTRRGANEPHVMVSNAEQLDSAGLDALFLQVLELDAASQDDERGRSITDLAREIKDRLGSLPAAEDQFEGLLLAAGFRWDDDYSDDRWLEGASHTYAVTAGFPRISSDEVPAGVTDLTYAILLKDCAGFECTATEMIRTIKGPSDVD